jgi:predicted dehydrogenase
MSLNLGILGFAHGHVSVYCDEWLKMSDQPVKLVAGWDHDAARLSAAHKKYKLKPCDSPSALLDTPALDAVIIGAETALHADLVEAATAAGKIIVLQKPLALTMYEADRIVAAVDRAKVPFTLAWQMRVDPQNVEMKRLVTSGRLGRVYMVRRRHGLSTHTWTGFEDTWHVKPELNRGMWADDASHAIDFILWLLGKPESVVAEIDTLRSPKVPDDHGIAIFRYADGTFADVMCSFTCLAGENTTEIVGEDGVIIQNFGDGPSTAFPRESRAVGLKWIRKDDKWWTNSAIASPDNHRRRIEALAPELLKFLRGERGPVATAEEGRTALAMTLACYDSAATGRRVQIG